MRLNNLKPANGAKHSAKRPGRGIGSGLGKTGGRGHKGQKSRAGGFHKVGFEGGQMPMQRRLPKRGFKSLNRVEYAHVNVGKLDAFEANSTVDLEALQACGLINKVKSGVKVLATGEITKPLTVKAHKFSAAAKEKIVAAGGKVEELQP